MTIRISFHGATSAIGGNCVLVEHEGGRLLVDCGLHQGTKTLRDLNRRPLPFAAAEIDLVLLTGGEPGRAGLLPRLVGEGFCGPIMAREPVCDLLQLLLPDWAETSALEAALDDRRRQRRGLEPAPPLYGREDAGKVLKHLEACDQDRWFEAAPAIRVRFSGGRRRDDGTMTSCSAIELEVGALPRRLLFSGSIAPTAALEPAYAGGFDAVVVSAPRGDRVNQDVGAEARRQRLAVEIDDAAAAGGPLLVPIFGSEATSELLGALRTAIDRGTVPGMPIFLDSSVARGAARLFGWQGEAGTQPAGGLRLCVTPAERREIDEHAGPAIVLAGDGSGDGGRIRHHLLRHLWRPEATVLLVGQQAPGSLGSLLASGEKRVQLRGQEVKVAARIRQIDGFLGEADQAGLVSWITGRLPVQEAVYLTGGEDYALKQLRLRLIETGIVPARIVIPHLDQRFGLGTDEAGVDKPTPPPRPRLDPRFAASPSDWHNAHARLVLDIAQELRQMPDDRLRIDLLNRLRRTLRS